MSLVSPFFGTWCIMSPVWIFGDAATTGIRVSFAGDGDGGGDVDCSQSGVFHNDLRLAALCQGRSTSLNVAGLVSMLAVLRMTFNVTQGHWQCFEWHSTLLKVIGPMLAVLCRTSDGRSRQMLRPIHGGGALQLLSSSTTISSQSVTNWCIGVSDYRPLSAFETYEINDILIAYKHQLSSMDPRDEIVL